MAAPRLAALELAPDTGTPLTEPDARAVAAWLRACAEAIVQGERQGLFVLPAPEGA